MLILGLVLLALIVEFALFTFWDKYVISFLLLVGTAVAAWFFVPEFVSFVTETGWKTLLLYVGYYVGIGIAVATLKWVFFNLRVGRKLRDAREKFEHEKDASALSPEDKRREFFRVIDTYSIYKRAVPLYDRDTTSEENFIGALTPRAKNYIERISFWVLQWPFVVLQLLLEDLILKVGRWLSEVFDVVFTRMGRLIVGNAIKGM